MNFFFLRSNFTTSPAGATPIAHIFLLSWAKEALPNDMGPLVSRTSSGVVSALDADSGSAQSAVKVVLVLG